MRGLALVLTFAALSVVSADCVASISYNSPVTNATIWGTGNTNQGFTVVKDNGIEIGIRAKTRYPLPDDSLPNGTKNLGNGDYGPFPTVGYQSNGTPGGPRGSWNFDWSVNSDYLDDPNGGPALRPLSSFTYMIDIDSNPSQGTSFTTFDLLGNLAHFDHQFGTNATLSNGIKATSMGDAQTLAGQYNLMQNSWNLAFFFNPLTFDPTLDGTYTVTISAFQAGTAGALATASIDVIVGNGGAPVPEPISFLTWGGLIGCAVFAARRQQR
jgi:hypothetical protein